MHERKPLIGNPLVDAVQKNLDTDSMIRQWIGPRALRMLSDLTSAYKERIRYIYTSANLIVDGRARRFPSAYSGVFINSVLRRYGFIKNQAIPNAYVGLYPPENERENVFAFEVTGYNPGQYATLSEHKRAIKPWVVDKLGIPTTTMTIPGRVTKSGRPVYVADYADYVAGAIAKVNNARSIPPANIFGRAAEDEQFLSQERQIIDEFLLDLSLNYGGLQEPDKTDSGLIP